MLGNIIWLYGMSGAGKTTLGSRLSLDLNACFLDGDVMRRNLGIEPKFDPESRKEYMNLVRRYLQNEVKMDKLFVISAITPYNEMRNMNREVFNNYYEVLIKCGLDILIKRDVKGLYEKALKKEIPYFTGISDSFEEGNPDLIINTSNVSEEESYKVLYTKVIQWLVGRCYNERVSTASY